MNFTKMHGLGNDFIIIDGISTDLSSVGLSTLAVKLCNRNFGIGADGLILVEKSDKADAKMRIINSDGSEPEMCGNGIRCFAKYIYDTGITTKTKISVETKAGLILPTLVLNNNKVVEIIVDMGEPHLLRKEIPMTDGNPNEKVVNQISAFGQFSLPITALSMGNPHCVIFVGDVQKAEVSKIGQQIENSELFPQRTNVEFAQILDKDNIRMRVWERGSGETLACGTGACAVAAAGVLTGQSNRLVTVQLPGGKLAIEWKEADNHVLMTGPAKTVFTGEIKL